MNIGSSLVRYSVDRPKTVTAIMVGLTLAIAVAATLPSLWPRTFVFMHGVEVDTDPENMLPHDEPVRVFHDRMKETLSLNDMVVVGVVNPGAEQGVFNPMTLHRIYELTEYARTLSWPDRDEPGEYAGVIEPDTIALSTVDNIEQGGLGAVKFEWLMPEPPLDDAAALAVRDKARDIPFLHGTLVSDKKGGKAVALYLPLSAKDQSYRIYSALNERIPYIVRWGRVRKAWRSIEAESGDNAAWRELNRLGRLAAQQAESQEAFERAIRWLADRSTNKAEDSFTLGVSDALVTDSIRSLENDWLERLDELRTELDKKVKANATDEELRRARLDLWLARIAASEEIRRAMRQAAGRLKGIGGRLVDYRLASRRSLVIDPEADNPSLADRLLDDLKEFEASAADALGGGPLPETSIATTNDALDAAAEAEDYHITGLPVAEDTFGVEMFKQMAISAPLAMVVIFILMYIFFRRVILIVSPMIVAMVSVIITMGLLVVTGQTIHIMSSMIPIFIMPIAVLDAVHILSEFFDRYQETKDRRATSIAVMETLFTPMLYTSLTTAVGFASLALTPIPPVQVFGLFIALGVLMAWLWTVTFVPAFIMFIPARRLENFGLAHHGDEAESASGPLNRLLRGVGRVTYKGAPAVIVVTLLLTGVAAWGISQIVINDNPTKWFEPDHPIRVADRVLNDHFGGTYMAYLAMDAVDVEQSASDYLAEFTDRLEQRRKELAAEDDPVRNLEKVFGQVARIASNAANDAGSPEALLKAVRAEVSTKLDEAPDDEYFAWEEAMTFIDLEAQRSEAFKDPGALRFVASLQDYLTTVESPSGKVVGKSNSLTDIVKTVHRELLGGAEDEFRVPDRRRMVAETLIQFQNSHRPQDLWHFVTPDYRTTSLWIQLTSGDNRDMSRVVAAVEAWMAVMTGDRDTLARIEKNRPERIDHVLAHYEKLGDLQESDPAAVASQAPDRMAAIRPAIPIEHNWFGLTYINVVWQEKMVSGMLVAFLGSFLVVFLMMTLLFRSALWGLLSMIPLTVTIALIYGTIGIVGKDYDMPVAVLSSLSLGLAVDYAIHFLARSRMLHAEHGSWKEAVGPVFGEPARAIARNVLVIGVGFLPLLAAPLVPYQTVGIFIAAILLCAGVATLLILPALIRILEPLLFPATRAKRIVCQCGTCIVTSIALVLVIGVNVFQFLEGGWTALTWLGVPAILVLAGICAFMSRREKCAVEREESKGAVPGDGEAK